MNEKRKKPDEPVTTFAIPEEPARPRYPKPADPVYPARKAAGGAIYQLVKEHTYCKLCGEPETHVSQYLPDGPNNTIGTKLDPDEGVILTTPGSHGQCRATLAAIAKAEDKARAAVRVLEERIGDLETELAAARAPKPSRLGFAFGEVRRRARAVAVALRGDFIDPDRWARD